jgi:hypothetical protein
MGVLVTERGLLIGEHNIAAGAWRCTVMGWMLGWGGGAVGRASRRRWAWSHHAASRFTHCDRVASGEAINISPAEEVNAASMEDHRPGLANKFVVSRNTRRARGRYQGWQTAPAQSAASMRPHHPRHGCRR